jgi:hypothetical protein
MSSKHTGRRKGRFSAFYFGKRTTEKLNFSVFENFMDPSDAIQTDIDSGNELV